MVGIEGKNKDTDKARKDLEDWGIRQELWLIERPNGSYVKPHASFSLTVKQREAFFEFLKLVKYPDGYAANISRSVNATNGRQNGLKSHDYHILIQRVLPIGMRDFVNKEISTTLFELGSFFQDLCSKTLRRSEIEKLEERIVLILCKLEKIFPPAFFDVMVHLAVHLPREAILGGPVQYRWMYPFERFLGTLKGFVSNRARPEGSIAEAYIVKECISFCSLYLDGVETVHNRPERNEDSGEHRKGYTVFTDTAHPIGLVTRDSEISQEHRDIAHWFVLFNSLEIKKYLEEHKNLMHVPNGQNITNVQRKEFPEWFKLKINRLRANKSKVATDELWSLANGPNLLVKEYSGCIINGVRYRIREVDNRRRSQNSGVLAEGDHEGKMHNFYGHLIKVLEFEYMCQKNVILFQCEWYNTGNTGRNYTIRADNYCTSIDVKSRWYQSDPFILPSQAKQVFYLNDTKWGEPWQVVQLVQHRGVFDIPEVGDSEPPDPQECNDAFQQESMTSGVPIDMADNISYHREDVEVEVIVRGH
ncbi:hypothetical protein Vadar_008568 [Vaccinium darrowii]|uniref:Uncharacterized protein n=1 Tax=Vaccinium darrowii TaxID=229202 RepID=A0ACB7ZAE4_9ERIC|nr:hypothetical protein Vadar_008568 [Vaccinium darrowii]